MMAQRRPCEHPGREGDGLAGQLASNSFSFRFFMLSAGLVGGLSSHCLSCATSVELVDQPVVDFTEEQFDRLFAINTKGTFFTLQQAAKHVADNGRIIYIGSSTTAFPLANQGLHGGGKMAARFLVQVLAKEIGHRGVTVNTIIPTVIDAAGIFTHLEKDAPQREFVKSYNPMGRMGRVDDVGRAGVERVNATTLLRRFREEGPDETL
jgi:NAD(P)-dependent dehydrogenase (short-subunit alcohol dehydrogenase family)